MKKFATLMCLMALLMVGATAFAYGYNNNGCCPDRCNPCADECFDWCDLDFCVHADYIYWKYTRADDFVVAALGGDQTVIFPESTYESGYRVGGSIGWGCWDFGVLYTSIHPTQKKLRDDTGTGGGELAGVDYSLDFQTVDLGFGYMYQFECRNGYARPFVGAKLAWLDEKVDRTVIDNTITRKQDLDAYGPMLGIEVNWELFDCCVAVSFIARGDFSVLCGSYTFSDTPVNEIRCDNASFISVHDIYLGLGFDLCSFCCVDLDLQVGYEAQVWHGLTSFVEPQLTASTSNDTLGFGGLVVHFRACF